VKKSKAKPLSESRQRLASLIQKREDTAGRIKDLQAALDRLRTAQAAEPQVAEELTALDARETVEMAAWCREGGEAPTVDSEKRAEITRRLAEARGQAEAARRAEAGVVAEQTREAQSLGRLGVPIRFAVAEIIAESIDPLCDEFRTMNEALAIRAAELSQAADLLLAIGEAAKREDADGATPILRLLESVSARLQRLFARPTANDHEASVSHAQWASLHARLYDDAAATLEA